MLLVLIFGIVFPVQKVTFNLPVLVFKILVIYALILILKGIAFLFKKGIAFSIHNII